jgi:membrane protease YdiL (CAAX protease family)
VKSLGLLGVVVGVLVVTAAVSPWVASACADLGYAFSFPRVYDRVFEVLLAVGVLAAWRPLALGGARELGLAGGAPGRDVGRGIVGGILGLAAALSLCWVLGALVPALRFPLAKTVRKALLGLAAAGAIGVGEEIVFRGVVLSRVRRDFGDLVGVVVTTAVYAAVHVLRVRGGDGVVGLGAGFEQTARLFGPLASRAAVPSLVGLAFLGTLLAAARLRSGALWLPVGIHAAFVAVFRVGRLFFEIRPVPAWLVGGSWPPLVGGVAGWLAVAVAAAVALGRRRRA